MSVVIQQRLKGVEAEEKSYQTRKKTKGKLGRPKKGEEKIKEPTRLEKQKEMNLDEMLADLPSDCDVGTKQNSKGYTETWIGL